MIKKTVSERGGVMCARGGWGNVRVGWGNVRARVG